MNQQKKTRAIGGFNNFALGFNALITVYSSFICWLLGSLLFAFLAKANTQANKYLRMPEYAFSLFEYGFSKIERFGKPFQGLNQTKLIYLKRFEGVTPRRVIFPYALPSDRRLLMRRLKLTPVQIRRGAHHEIEGDFLPLEAVLCSHRCPQVAGCQRTCLENMTQTRNRKF